MFEIEVTSNIGDISVATENNKGLLDCGLKIVKICGISENATPEVRQQAEAFKVAVRQYFITCEPSYNW